MSGHTPGPWVYRPGGSWVQIHQGRAISSGRQLAALVGEAREAIAKAKGEDQ